MSHDPAIWDGRPWAQRGGERRPMTAAGQRDTSPLVRVVAVTDNWLMNGERVTAGSVYELPIGEAQRLVAVGKAQLA